MKKKLGIFIAVLAVFVLAFAGCGGNPADSSTDGGDSDRTDDGAAAGLKIAIVTSPSGVDDGSFNEDNYNGILEFQKTHPETAITPVQETDLANALNAVAEIAADYDVIVVPGYQFADVSTLAEENPDKYFILVDSAPTAIGDKEVFDNIYSMTFVEQESGFFAGIAAALETESGKVAVVNGIAYPSNVNYQYGFEAGVNYAVTNLGATAEIVEIASRAGTDVTGANVGGNYIGDFNDEATGKVVGNELIAEGVDIIFVAAGNAGNGVFTAAKEAGNVKVIGCDVDQYDDGVNGADNIILTSVLKNMAINVTRALDAIADGTFEGENALLGADTDSTGYVYAEGRQQLSEDTLAALADAYTDVKGGKIVPPGNFTGTTPEDFPGLK